MDDDGIEGTLIWYTESAEERQVEELIRWRRADGVAGWPLFLRGNRKKVRERKHSSESIVLKAASGELDMHHVPSLQASAQSCTKLHLHALHIIS